MKVFLRAFEPEDYLLINKWRRNDDFYQLTMANKYFISQERDKEWVKEKSIDDRKEIYLAICLVSNNEMIGYLSIKNIDWRNRKAMWGGITIGEVDNQRQGLAYDASILMFNYIFDELGLNKFYGYWLESHLPSIKLAIKLGFVQEGVLRDEAYKLGKFHNAILFSILKSEYDKLYKQV
jgi:[ribosomal protein S5]-alanine N-acetyltransferase